MDAYRAGVFMWNTQWDTGKDSEDTQGKGIWQVFYRQFGDKLKLNGQCCGRWSITCIKHQI